MHWACSRGSGTVTHSHWREIPRGRRPPPDSVRTAPDLLTRARGSTARTASGEGDVRPGFVRRREEGREPEREKSEEEKERLFQAQHLALRNPLTAVQALEKPEGVLLSAQLPSFPNGYHTAPQRGLPHGRRINPVTRARSPAVAQEMLGPPAGPAHALSGPFLWAQISAILSSEAERHLGAYHAAAKLRPLQPPPRRPGPDKLADPPRLGPVGLCAVPSLPAAWRQRAHGLPPEREEQRSNI
ncbi:hypothetical protein JZ751_021979 [Albula glossodonta]|uniref:Uncharacterized protein n=1 Tax=Albula glossodonta TaxID=121402 RepID=A0A8T2NIH6_9TELE|nr:hypothetical protein JZ751_021979 [Albula glossodonta]